MKIVQFSNDNSSILIQCPSVSNSYSSQTDNDFAFLEGIWGVSYNFIAGTWFQLKVPPIYTYFWVNATTPIKDPASGFYATPLIFPLYNGTHDLKSIITQETKITGEDSAYGDYKSNFIEGNGNLTGHYSTTNAGGYHNPQSQIEDITVHEGSGITTYALWYSNDEVNLFMVSDTLTLVSTSFDLNSRPPPPSPIISPSPNPSPIISPSPNPSPTPTPTPTPTPIPPPPPFPSLLLWGALAAVVVIAIVAGFVFMRRKSRNKHAQDIQPIIPPPPPPP
jgi:hypothetical protein